jgi:hypothetical protein
MSEQRDNPAKEPSPPAGADPYPSGIARIPDSGAGSGIGAITGYTQGPPPTKTPTIKIRTEPPQDDSEATGWLVELLNLFPAVVELGAQPYFEDDRFAYPPEASRQVEEYKTALTNALHRFMGMPALLEASQGLTGRDCLPKYLQTLRKDVDLGDTDHARLRRVRDRLELLVVEMRCGATEAAHAPPPKAEYKAGAAADKQQLTPAEEKAYQSNAVAEGRMEPPPKNDHDAYKWLQDHPEAIEPYDLPRSFETWQRKVRSGRKFHGTQKNHPRASRGHGPSLVKRTDI